MLSEWVILISVVATAASGAAAEAAKPPPATQKAKPAATQPTTRPAATPKAAPAPPAAAKKAKPAATQPTKPPAATPKAAPAPPAAAKKAKPAATPPAKAPAAKPKAAPAPPAAAKKAKPAGKKPAAPPAAKPKAAPVTVKQAKPVAKKPVPPPAVKPKAAPAPPAPVEKAKPATKKPTAAPAAQPGAAFTVPERRLRALLAERGGARIKLPPELYRKVAAVATQSAATSQPAMDRPPARAMEELQLSGAEVQFEIIGNKLVLRGDSKDLNQLERFIDDVGQDLPRPEIEMVPLPLNVSAEEIAPIVEDIFNRIASPTARPEDRVNVVAEPRSNSLILGVVADQLDSVMKVIDMIAKAEVFPDESSVQLVELKHINPDEARQLLLQYLSTIQGARGAAAQQAIEERIKIETVPRFNQLMISASPADIDRVMDLLEEWIDVPPDEKGGALADMLMIRLENTEAEDLVLVLEEIIQAGQAARGGNAGAQDMRKALSEQIRRLRVITTTADPQSALPELDLEKPIRLVAEPNTNSVLIGSTEENLRAMEEVVRLLDSVPIAPAVQVRIFMLENADADAVVELLKTMFDEGKALPLRPGERPAELTPAVPAGPEGMGIVQQVGIAADTRTNAVIVSGKAESIALAETVVLQLDQEGMKLKHPLHLIEVEHASAQELVATIQELLTQRETLTQGKGDNAAALEKVFVIADMRSNSILISAKEDNYKEIVDLVQKLDSARDVMGEIRIITLDKTQASDLETKIVKLWTDRANMISGGTSTSRELPVIVSDTRSNALVIASSKSDFESIQKLVKQLEDQPLAPIADIRIIQLKNNDASVVGPMLQQLMQERMQQRYQQGQTEQPSDRVAIAADAANNLLVIASSQENFDLLDKLAKRLDASPLADREVKVVVLKHADATQLSQTVTNLFTAGLQRSEGISPPSPVKAELEKVSIVADMRANALLISANKTNYAIVDKLIKQLDVDGVGLDHPINIITVENASATDLVTTIEQLMTERQQRIAAREGQPAADLDAVFVSADVRSNSIIISAKEDNYKEIAELVQKLDGAPDRMGEIRIITLDKTQAADLAEKIEQMWQERIQQLTQGAKGGKQDEPVIFADTRSNALVIASSKSDFEAIQKLVEKLEKAPIADAARIRVIKLNHNDASTVGPMLQQFFEERLQNKITKGQEEQPSDRVAIATDAGNNLLLVACSPENFELMKELVEPLDASPELKGAVETFMLENADAEQLAQTLEDLFSEGVVTKNPLAAEGPLGQAMTKVTIVPDTRANALIISASEEYLELTRSLINELDGIGVPRIYENMKLIQVQHSDALRLQGMLEELFDRAGSGGGANVDIRTQIVADDRTNTLILWGSRAGVARAEEMIRKLDIEDPTETSTFVVYPLTDASAQKAGPMLQELFENRQGAGGGGQGERTPINILPDEGSNSLVVSASMEDHRLLEGLLNDLDKPSTFSTQMHFIPLAKAKAEVLADTLSELIEERLRAQGGGGGGASGTSISIAPETRTNSIIVWATPSDFEEIKEVVSKLDNITPDRKVEMRLFRLRNSLAEDLAMMLIDHLQAAGTGTTVTNVDGGGGGGGGRGDDEQAVLIRIQVVNPVTGELEERTMLRQDITVTPDAKSNTLMVTAPTDSIDMLESLIRTLDEIDPLTAQIHVFVLRNSSAEEMKTQLEELFQVGDFRPEDDRQRQILGLGGGGIALTGGVAGEGIVTGKDEITFTTDVRTNAVIAAGTEAQLRVVSEMIEQLDSIEIEDRLNSVITIKYNEAPLIQDAISSFIDEEVTRLERAGENQAVQRLVEREVTVVAQEETNRLLLSVSPRYESQVMEMIRQLDQPPPMVMIDLLLVEVSLNEDLEFGMEFALQDLLFSERAFVNSNGVLQGSEFDFVGGTDVGASGSGALGGFSFTITGEDFNFLLRTLKAESRLEVLSNPQIMAQDGKEANITIGENVPFVRNVNVLDTGQVQSSVEYEEIGIILNVTPHINPDGFVNMELAPEVSQITDSNVTITEGFTAPIFSNRSADTQVTIKDGETVVIGGLITTQHDERENKVPILGDMPGIGPLFRATSMSRRRQELLWIITPHVVRGSDDGRDLSEQVIVEDTPSIDEHMRDNPLFERLQRKPGDQIKGVPIDLMQGSGNGNDRDAGAASGEPAQADEDVYAPSPDVYGPPRPANVTVSPADGSVGAQMVGPENYEQYLKQRR